MVNIIDYYFSTYEKYAKIYGKDKLYHACQVGSFMEFYSTPTEGPDLKKLSDVLNIVVSRKDKSITTVDRKNPNMMGYPLVSHQKFMKIMLDNGLIVVVTEQVTPPPFPKRKITGVYTSGTSIDETNPENNFVMTVYIEEINKKYIIGVCLIDVSTGELFIHETCNQIQLDEKYPLDEVVNIYTNYQPKEVLIVHDLKTMCIDDIMEYLECESSVYMCKSLLELKKMYKDIEKLTYQRELLYKIYPNIDKLSHCVDRIFSILEIDNYTYGRLAMCISVNHIHDNNPTCLKQLHYPTIMKQKDTMYLGNNVLQQLNIVKSDNVKTKFDSVLKIINNTLTPMGSRYLKKQLLEPCYNSSILKERYNLIDKIRNDDVLYENMKQQLNFNDIEKMYRKMDMNIIHPMSFYVWYENMKRGIEFIKFLNTWFNLDIENTSLIEMIESIESTFEIEQLNLYLLNDISGRIFKRDVHSDLDVYLNHIGTCTDYIDKLAVKLQMYIKDGNIKVMKNDAEGHYLVLTTKRANILQGVLSKMTSIDLDNNTAIPVNSLHFKLIGKGSNTKIIIPEMKMNNDKLKESVDKVKQLSKFYFIQFINSKLEKYRKSVLNLIHNISFYDFIYSGAKTSLMYNYTRPNIIDSDKSFVRTTGMRHPIIELISHEIYVPTDIKIGIDDEDCILLYGLNSAGKSTLQKALGINVILAQIGYFVACNTFDFNPYHSILARISSNDNIFKGMSSFALEISELKAILKRSSPNTLVIADEICKGSEHQSSIIIVMTIIEMLSKTKTSLISASHLHEIASNSRIKSLSNVHLYHLHIEFDETSNTIIYNRELRKGSGEHFYGLNVAKYLINDIEFNKITNDIRQDYLISQKWSKYNTNLNIDKCRICNYTPKKSADKPLEVHHIEFQKHANKHGHVKTKSGKQLHKNHIGNLVVLCQQCHDKIDTKHLIIYGYIETSNGKILDYTLEN